MKNLLYIIIIICFFSTSFAIETKIIYRVQNEIITNIDLKNEFKYLLALNNQLKDLDKDKVFALSKKSIIRDKIKKIEILNNFKDLSIEKKYEDFLIKDIYSKLNLNTKEQFVEYLKKYNLKLNFITDKIAINALWNELIFKKYSSKIEINKNKIKKDIDIISKGTTKDFLLSEIIFEVENKGEIDKKFNQVKKSIEEIGFENTVSLFSISDSVKVKGNIGWVNEESLSSKIRDRILNAEDDITRPIILPNGIMVLKINDIKEATSIIDYDSEFKKAIDYERNRQLNQYSTIYFNKIKKNLEFNE
jgi:peptidyl-prolyl cis-trans isomerase SurA